MQLDWTPKILCLLGVSYFSFNTKLLSIFSHEESLASAFRVFGIQSTNYKRSGMPTYASCITVELYRNNRSGEYSVKVISKT